MNIVSSRLVSRLSRLPCFASARIVALLFFYVWLPMVAVAQDVPHADNIISVSDTFDRGILPGDIPIWTSVQGGYITGNQVPHNFYGRMGWVCNSESDTSTGACPVGTANSLGTGESAIHLRFTERRSRLHVDLSLRSYSEQYWMPHVGCPRRKKPMHHVATTNCGSTGLHQNAADLTVILPQSELAKIPSGGVWVARVELHQATRSMFGVDTRVAAFNADIELKVTDNNNIQLYLPAFGNADPRVDLNLRTQPLSGPGGTGMVSGQSVIDACLYDGYNSNSHTFETRLSDPMSLSPEYFVRRVGSAVDLPYNQVKYRVITRTAAQAPVERESGVSLNQAGMDVAEIRAVRLPGVPFPVVCTPFPIQLLTDPFPQNSKGAGRYTGTLKVEFTPSTTAP